MPLPARVLRSSWELQDHLNASSFGFLGRLLQNWVLLQVARGTALLRDGAQEPSEGPAHRTHRRARRWADRAARALAAHEVHGF